MPITLKPVEQIADKWSRRAQASSPDYTAGVANPRQDWAGAAAAAEGSFEQGVQEAIGAKRFGREVRKAGTAKWQTRATTLGAQRFVPGVAAGKADFQSGFTPFASVLSAVSLPAKGPRGAPGNLERVRAVADALHQKRVSGS